MPKEPSFATRQKGPVPFGKVILPANRFRPSMKSFRESLFIHDPQNLDRSVMKKLKPILVDIVVIIDVLLEPFQFLAPIGY